MAHSMQSPTSTIRTIGIQSSSRVVGRSTAAVPGAAEAPGTAAVVPSASMAAGEPGAIDDSPRSNRSTAKRTGAFGSTTTAEVPGDADGPPLAAAMADGRGVGPPAPDGAGDAATTPVGVTV